MARHPTSLYLLSCVEMWERWGYYLMVAIFALFLNEGLGLSTGEAASVFGTFTGLVYATPLLGGLLADRWLGYRRSVLLGAALLAVGYALLSAATSTGALFWASVAVMAAGNGLFKPNISTMVGNLYPAGDPRRDGAFSTFYVGINVGALVSPFVAAYVRRRWGWAAAFECAAAGMLVAVAVLISGWRRLAVADGRSSLAAVLGTPLPAAYEDRTPATDALGAPTDPTETRRRERQRVAALLTMCAVVTLFWVAFQQSGSTLTFWARDDTARPTAGWLASVLGDEEQFAAVNPLFVVLLTPPLLYIFAALRRRGREPSTPDKLLLGMVVGALAFAVMVAAACARSSSRLPVSPAWLVSSYLLATVAELLLSPMGLSMVARLAPRRHASLFMGVWCLSSAVGNKLAGVAGSYWDRTAHAHFFAAMSAACLLAAALVALRLRSLRSACADQPSPMSTPLRTVQVDLHHPLLDGGTGMTCRSGVN